MPDSYVDFVLEQLSALEGSVTARPMMGGRTLYCDGVVFGLVAEGAFYLKADAVNLPTFAARGLPAFRPDPEKPGTMSYYLVPADVLEDREMLARWARESVAAGARARARKSAAGGRKSR